MSHTKRRQNLIYRMDSLEAQGFGCKGCSGTCCTYEANSMMVTPLEAFELLHYLKINSLLDTELKEKVSATVSQYRLDHQFGNGKRSYLRRTYTCPFFNHQELGCPLPRNIKPYGCLAFNAHHETEKAGEHCHSEQAILIKREEVDPTEGDLNQRLKEKFQLIWDKSPLPTALINIWDMDVSDADLELY
jgi:hypothetical protein